MSAATMAQPSTAVDRRGMRPDGIEVVKRAGSAEDRSALWLCRCPRGHEFVRVGSSLRVKRVICPECAPRRTEPVGLASLSDAQRENIAFLLSWNEWPERIARRVGVPVSVVRHLAAQ